MSKKFPLNLSNNEKALIAYVDAHRRRDEAMARLAAANEELSAATKEFHIAEALCVKLGDEHVKARKSELTDLIKSICTGDTKYINSTLERLYE